jgi:molybdopterin-guanine dinucleotide biosynthesis protein A
VASIITQHANITAVILAGGQARRMGGGDKGLVSLAGRPMIEYVLEALKPQLENILINANRNREVYESYHYPVIPDLHEGYKGPLEGMISAMASAETDYIITVPCDAPLLPDDYVERMLARTISQQADIGVADSGERIQPVFSILRCTLYESLSQYLDSGERKIDLWFQQHKMVKIDFSDKPEIFENINTREDVKNLEEKLLQ